MIRRPPRSTRTDTLFPYTTLFRSLLDDIYGGTVPDDFSLYLHHPSVTDPGMAPPGHSTFYALAPVAHLGKAKAEWDGDFGERFTEAILDEVERRVAPSLRANVVTRLHSRPADFGRALSHYLGS